MINVSFSFDNVQQAQEFLSKLSVDAQTKAEGIKAVAELTGAAGKGPPASQFLSPKGQATADAIGKTPPTVAAPAKVKQASTPKLNPLEAAKAKAAAIKAEAEAALAAKQGASVGVKATATTAAVSKPGAVSQKIQLLEINEVGGVATCWPPTIAESELSPELYSEWIEEYNAAMERQSSACPKTWAAICSDNHDAMRSAIVALATKVVQDKDEDMQAWLDSAKAMTGIEKFRSATDEQVSACAMILMLSVKGLETYFPA